MNTLLIPLQLDAPANVILALWDTTGSKLTTLKNEFMEAGQYEFAVCATDIGLAPKAYIYQLEVQNDTGIFCRYQLFRVPSAPEKAGKGKRPATR